jgi:hypothetical protein
MAGTIDIADAPYPALSAYRNGRWRLAAPWGQYWRHLSTVQNIQQALEGAGNEFLDENGGRLGVRLKIQNIRSRTIYLLTTFLCTNSDSI